jgi:uncharacterized protein YqfB (UPF0267 family)
MVAYGFKSRFAPLVESGAKTHTIRDARKSRHARPGEFVQLYTGLRTSQCRKLIDPDPICVSVQPIVFHPSKSIAIDNLPLSSEAVEKLALSDGFESVEEFWQFFGVPSEQVERFLISWQPQEAA